MATTDTILDRFENEEAVFLVNGSEANELRLPLKEIPISLKEGDTVRIHESKEGYIFERMREGEGTKELKIGEMIEHLRTRDKRNL